MADAGIEVAGGPVARLSLESQLTSAGEEDSEDSDYDYRAMLEGSESDQSESLEPEENEGARLLAEPYLGDLGQQYRSQCFDTRSFPLKPRAWRGSLSFPFVRVCGAPPSGDEGAADTGESIPADAHGVLLFQSSDDDGDYDEEDDDEASSDDGSVSESAKQRSGSEQGTRSGRVLRSGISSGGQRRGAGPPDAQDGASRPTLEGVIPPDDDDAPIGCATQGPALTCRRTCRQRRRLTARHRRWSAPDAVFGSADPQEAHSRPPPADELPARGP